MDATRCDDSQGRLSDLALTLAHEVSDSAEAPESNWGLSVHDIVLVIVEASGGSLPAIRAGIDSLDPVRDRNARMLLVRAEFYAAFWGD
jgi:hypothetical protein